MSACREARRLISRRPTKSPRLKLPFPCLNSHNGVSGDPVWKTSLTAVTGLACDGTEKRGQKHSDTDLCESHTCSIGEQMTRYWYA